MVKLRQVQYDVSAKGGEREEQLVRLAERARALGHVDDVGLRRIGSIRAALARLELARQNLPPNALGKVVFIEDVRLLGYIFARNRKFRTRLAQPFSSILSATSAP